VTAKRGQNGGGALALGATTMSLAACQLLLGDLESPTTRDDGGAPADASPTAPDAPAPDVGGTSDTATAAPPTCATGHLVSWSRANELTGTLTLDNASIAPGAGRDGGAAFRAAVTSSGQSSIAVVTLPLSDVTSWAGLRWLRVKTSVQLSLPLSPFLSVVFLRTAFGTGGNTAPTNTDLYAQADIGVDKSMSLRAASREGGNEAVVGPLSVSTSTSASWFDVTFDFERTTPSAPTFTLTVGDSNIGTTRAHFDAAAKIGAPVLEVHAGIEVAEAVSPTGVTVIVDALSIEACTD